MCGVFFFFFEVWSILYYGNPGLISKEKFSSLIDSLSPCNQIDCKTYIMETQDFCYSLSLSLSKYLKTT